MEADEAADQLDLETSMPRTLQELLTIESGGMYDGDYVLTFRGSTPPSHENPYWNASAGQIEKLRAGKAGTNLVLLRRAPDEFGFAIPFETIDEQFSEERKDRHSRWHLHIRSDRLAVGNDWENAVDIGQYKLVAPSRLDIKGKRDTPGPDEGSSENEVAEETYVIRSILLRRGSKEFRDALLERYGNRCVVTGCRLIDILEAAHIEPYHQTRDNSLQNGLLLRADIHTLFDLGLLQIEPVSLSIHLATDGKVDPYLELEGRTLLVDDTNRPSVAKLKSRWRG